AAIPARQRGHAAPLLLVPRSLSRPQRDVDARCVHARRSAGRDAALPRAFDQVRPARARQPVGLPRFRMAHAHTTAHAQLRRADRSGVRPLRLRPGAATVSSVLHEQYDSLERQHATAKLGMWVFLGSEALLFAGLIALYAAYRFVYSAEFHM